MSKREPKYTKKTGAKADEYWLRKSLFTGFNSSLLGLKDLLRNKETFEALAVILDLKDFTAFCDQRDPHHEVPKFIHKFLDWLFRRIAEELFNREDGNQVVLWSHLPIFGKFLGDGVLLLWDVTDLSSEAKENVVLAFDVISTEYETVLFKTLKRDFTKPPSKLRCGIAQGAVTSIADGKDYVGLCINIASRLQKLSDGAFSFAFTKKGLEKRLGASWYDHFKLIKIPIRGVAKEELVYVLKNEFIRLSKEEQRKLRP
jgi:hypothetical protein